MYAFSNTNTQPRAYSEESDYRSDCRSNKHIACMSVHQGHLCVYLTPIATFYAVAVLDLHHVIGLLLTVAS